MGLQIDDVLHIDTTDGEGRELNEQDHARDCDGADRYASLTPRMIVSGYLPNGIRSVTPWKSETILL